MEWKCSKASATVRILQMSVDGYQFEIHQRGPRSVVRKNIILLKTHLSNVFIESHTAAENVNAPWQPEDRFSKLSVDIQHQGWKRFPESSCRPLIKLNIHTVVLQMMERLSGNILKNYNSIWTRRACWFCPDSSTHDQQQNQTRVQHCRGTETVPG